MSFTYTVIYIVLGTMYISRGKHWTFHFIFQCLVHLRMLINEEEWMNGNLRALLHFGVLGLKLFKNYFLNRPQSTSSQLVTTLICGAPQWKMAHHQSLEMVLLASPFSSTALPPCSSPQIPGGPRQQNGN